MITTRNRAYLEEIIPLQAARPLCVAQNLTGNRKLASLKHRFEVEFDYTGKARPDLPLLAAPGEPMLANPNSSTNAPLRGASR